MVAPINTSAVGQTKAGSLTIGGNLKIGSATFVCNASAAGTLKYDAADHAVLFCDGTKMRKIAYYTSVPTADISLAKTTVASAFPVLLGIFSNDVSTCNVAATGNALFEPASSNYGEVVAMNPGGVAGDSSVTGSTYFTPILSATSRSGAMGYRVTCSNVSGLAQKDFTLTVKKYESITSVSGEGNWGESCVDYLTRRGVRGDKAIPPALSINNTLTQGQCTYRVKHPPTANFMDTTCWFNCPVTPDTYETHPASVPGDSETPPRTECGILCFPSNSENMAPVIGPTLYTAGR